MDDNESEQALAQRLAQLKCNNSCHSDEELIQRLEKLNRSDSTPRNYSVPAGYDSDEAVEKLLQEAELWQDSETEDSDYLAAVLGSSKESQGVSQNLEALNSIVLGRHDVIGSCEETNTLLQQCRDETSLEQKHKSREKEYEDDLEKRLFALKSSNFTPPTPQTKPRVMGKVPEAFDKEDLYDEVDDWCCICNDDATMVCDGCDQDKFCDACFFEGHRGPEADYDASRHKARKYQQRSN